MVRSCSSALYDINGKLQRAIYTPRVVRITLVEPEGLSGAVYLTCNWNCYVLVIKVRDAVKVRLRGRVVTVKPGVYFYIGSSRKPCTVLARIARHASKEKPVRWHIDQITTTEKAEVSGAILVDLRTLDCELELAKAMKVAGLAYIRGFGSTDKPLSGSHMFKCHVDDVVECAGLAYELVERTPGSTGLVYAMILGK